MLRYFVLNRLNVLKIVDHTVKLHIIDLVLFNKNVQSQTRLIDWKIAGLQVCPGGKKTLAGVPQSTNPDWFGFSR